MMAKTLGDLRYSKATQELIRVWADLPRAEGQVCPKRCDFSSIRIAAFLAEVFTSQWSDDGEDLKIIQAGTLLDTLLGRDITGMSIFGVVPEALREDERTYYSALRDTPCAGMITRHARNLRGRPIVYRTIQLPLLNAEGNVAFFVGTGVALSAQSQIEEFGTLQEDTDELLERRFFDIGGGTPSTHIP